jgi:hypothetical protein
MVSTITGGNFLDVWTIINPLAASQAVNVLSRQLAGLGYRIASSSNAAQLASSRQSSRGGLVTPFFDENVSGLDANRFFWLQLSDERGAIVALQAFRCDLVTTSLADWAPTYHIGLYMRRKELCAPSFVELPQSSRTHKIRGRVVYHGELWVDPHVRNRKVFNAFTRAGIILAYIKWNADAVWALAAEQMATHGHPQRMGYSQVESGFLKWDWAPPGNPLLEYLLLSERSAIEHLIMETAADKKAEDEPEGAAQEPAQILPFKLPEYQQERAR